jgi:hypothetical protein
LQQFIYVFYKKSEEKGVKLGEKIDIKHIFWQELILGCVVLSAFVVPYNFAYHQSIQGGQKYLDLFISFIFTCDFFIKYISSKTKQDKDYKALTLDFLAIIPTTFILSQSGYDSIPNLFLFLSMIRLVKVTQYFAFLNQFPVVPKYLKSQTIIIGALLAVHWIACGWSIIYPVLDGDITTVYIKSLYWSITTLTTIGYGDVIPTDNIGRIYTMIIMILGVGVYGIIIANVSRMLTESDRNKERSRQKLEDMGHLLKHYHIPERLQIQAINYYNYLLTKRLTDNHNSIISDLPNALQNELKTYMNMKLIKQNPLFKNSSIPCIKEVASKLEQLFFGPGQTIFQIGTGGNEMYFIGHGSVEIIDPNGNVESTLSEGQIFGEMALVQDMVRQKTVRAISYCDIYKLTREHFIEIGEKYPELLDKDHKTENFIHDIAS